jgi:predicted outer membrane repeat protein
MSIRSRVIALISVLALIGASAVLVSAVPASASTVAVTVTSAAETSGTCPSASDCTLRQALADASFGDTNGAENAEITIAEGLGTINLQSPLIYDGGNTRSLNLTLNGNGIAITGNDTFRLITSDTSGSVVIDQVAFSRGRDVLGGALQTRSDLTLTNSSFTANNADGNGGAVFASTSLEIDHVVFEDNDAPSGGAVFVMGSLFVQYSSFVNNSAANYGGAVGTGGIAGMEITTTSFTGNASDTAGGAVYHSGTMTFTDVVFEDNSATDYGGAFWGTADVDVSNAVFLNNSASIAGGAAFINGNSSIDNAMFISNESVPGGSGGAIKINGTLDLSDSTFEANSAANGGAILAASDLTASRVNFANNTVLASSGAIAVIGNAAITESSFDGNTSGEDGGAITVAGNLDLTNSTVSNNSSTTGQGALRVAQDAVISNSTITANAGGGQISTVSAATLTVAYATLTELETLANQDAIGTSGSNISLFATVLTGADGASAGSLCGSAVTSLGYNYATDSSCGLTETGDIEGAPLATAVVGALADHDGTMFTQLPLANGPLVGAIPNASCFLTSAALSTDQRGFARPNVDGGSCDIGAVQLTPQVSSTVAGRTITVSISEFTATATITMYSDPIVLGTIAIDAVGSGTGTFDVDCSVEGGTHTITATAAGGQTASITIELEACAVPAFTG